MKSCHNKMVGKKKEKIKMEKWYRPGHLEEINKKN